MGTAKEVGETSEYPRKSETPESQAVRRRTQRGTAKDHGGSGADRLLHVERDFLQP